MVAFVLWTFVPGVWGIEFLVYASMIAIPVAAIHGILRYGAFDIGPGDRGARVERSSNLLITVVYAAGVATPALLLTPPLRTVPAILLTTLLAVVLLPARSWMQRRLHRALFGDRERQFTMLSELGAQLEQAGDPRELLTRLAEAVRDGLDASWVQIRLVSTDAALAAVPIGVGGDVAGEPVESCDLVRGDEILGRIEVGPRRRGEYGDAERTLLRTVAGQAAASVANVRLTAQLAEQLDELTRFARAARRRAGRRAPAPRARPARRHPAGRRGADRRAPPRPQSTAARELTPEELVELQDQARETLTDLRELARGIHPPVLSDNGLVAAVESGVARYPIPLTVEADAAVRAERYSDEVETTAYYVVREALANTAKHANATHASVGLARSNGHLRIAITDDGSRLGALVPASVSTGGLANIRDRVAALRGTVSVSAAQPSGTTVLVDLPVDGLDRAADREADPLDETGTLRVVIAEDNYLVREGLRRLLEDSGEIDVVASTGNATELLDAVRRLDPHAVLTDIRMPPGHHMEGIEAARDIRAAHPETGVVVLSQHADESYALALFSDGSAGLGYLLKDRIGDLEDLVHALREVLRGRLGDRPPDRGHARAPTQRGCGESARRAVAAGARGAARDGAGKTNAGIEQALFLSSSTVEKHVNAIFTKLRLPEIGRAPAGRRGAGVPAERRR